MSCLCSTSLGIARPRCPRGSLRWQPRGLAGRLSLCRGGGAPPHSSGAALETWRGKYLFFLPTCETKESCHPVTWPALCSVPFLGLLAQWQVALEQRPWQPGENLQGSGEKPQSSSRHAALQPWAQPSLHPVQPSCLSPGLCQLPASPSCGF